MEVRGVWMGEDDLLSWQIGRRWAGLFRVVEWSHRIPKQWWSGLKLVEWNDYFGSGVLPNRL